MLGGISEQFSHLGNSIWEGTGGEDWACRHHRLPVDTHAQEWLSGQWAQWVSLGSPLGAGRANKWLESPRAVWDAVSFASPSSVPMKKDRKGLAQEDLSQSELKAVRGPPPCTPGSQLLQFLKLSTFSNGHPGWLFSVHTAKSIPRLYASFWRL